MNDKIYNIKREQIFPEYNFDNYFAVATPHDMAQKVHETTNVSNVE